jgi:elongation factor 1-beta
MQKVHIHVLMLLFRFRPSQADVVVFDTLGKAPDMNVHVHANRWYKHISSFDAATRQKFPGEKKPLNVYGPPETSSQPTKGDDVDLFGEENDEEAERIRQERIAQYNAKKAQKPQVIAKSQFVLDVKPWDDTTDLKEMEGLVRGIRADGLEWGASKLVPVGFGIRKLQIACVVEDDKIGTDFLEEEITAFEDLVQSVDVVSFNKL